MTRDPDRYSRENARLEVEPDEHLRPDAGTPWRACECGYWCPIDRCETEDKND